MKKIDKNSKVFELPEFQKDKYKFNLIYLMLESDTALFISDEENYIIGRGTIGYPTWIWTKDNLSKEKVQEIEENLKLYLTDEEKNQFTCKKELYDYLVENNYKYLNQEDYFEMGFLYCKEPKKPKLTDGYIDKGKENDLEIITNYWYSSCKEMNDWEPITIEQAKEDAKEMINSGCLYVWKNQEGKIVTMGTYKENKGQARIRHVYTPKEERGKAYAANLIYEMTKLLLEKQLVPLLYTDYNYIPSNKAYINAGYEDTGILINFTCSKKKIKKK